jgi:hypothetical protein
MDQHQVFDTSKSTVPRPKFDDLPGHFRADMWNSFQLSRGRRINVYLIFRRLGNLLFCRGVLRVPNGAARAENQ